MSMANLGTKEPDMDAYIIHIGALYLHYIFCFIYNS